MNIVPRGEWGARPPRSVSTIATPSRDLWLHHTAGREPDGPDGVRQVQAFHMDSRGWFDIAYSFVIDRTGTVYEGRGPGVAGGHTAGHNTTSHAICVLGHYDRDPVPQAVVDAAGDLVAYGHREGWWANPYLSGGHRDVASTSCPGLNLYARIPEINVRATAQEDDTMPVTAPEDVRYYQAILAAEFDPPHDKAGPPYDIGAIDGIVGPRTADAIRDWQGKRGIAVTGTLTVTTCVTLQSHANRAHATEEASELGGATVDLSGYARKDHGHEATVTVR